MLYVRGKILIAIEYKKGPIGPHCMYVVGFLKNRMGIFVTMRYRAIQFQGANTIINDKKPTPRWSSASGL